MIEGILKVPPDDQVLLYQTTAISDHKPLSYYGLTDQTARAHNPAVLGLCLRDSGTLICQICLKYPVFCVIIMFKPSESGQFESLDITPYSRPPEMPEVMRCQENQPPKSAVSATSTAAAAPSSNPPETAAASRQ